MYDQYGQPIQGYTDEPYEYEPYEKPIAQPRRNSGARQPSNSRGKRIPSNPMG